MISFLQCCLSQGKVFCYDRASTFGGLDVLFVTPNCSPRAIRHLWSMILRPHPEASPDER